MKTQGVTITQGRQHLMRKTISALGAAVAMIVATLGLAAPAQASTGYILRSCTAYDNTLRVSSWINSNGTKTYHWKATSTSAHPFRRVRDVDRGYYAYAREGFLTVSNTTRDVWWGEWWANSARSHVLACSVTV